MLKRIRGKKALALAGALAALALLVAGGGTAHAEEVEPSLAAPQESPAASDPEWKYVNVRRFYGP